MHVLTVAWDQLININYAFLNTAKSKILEFQGSRVGIYYASFFRLKFLCVSHLKIKHFELPLCLQNWSYENKIDWDAHLMSYISCWLLLVSEFCKYLI